MKEQINYEPLFVYEYTRKGKQLTTPSEELAHSTHYYKPHRNE